MVGWHHQLNGQKSEQVPGDGEGQGSLVCCSPWGCKELDMTERLNNNKIGVVGEGLQQKREDLNAGVCLPSPLQNLQGLELDVQNCGSRLSCISVIWAPVRKAKS